MCDVHCEHGKCIAPNKCDCDQGYTHHSTLSLCIPHCEGGCTNGACINPNECECDKGYKHQNGSQNVCEPICELSCVNATCVAPDTCECHDGFSVHDENKQHECHCGPYCVMKDEMCHCLEEDLRVTGSQIRENFTAICSDSNCKNGVCLTPFSCECLDGFEKNENSTCVMVNETCVDEPELCHGNSTDEICNCINGLCLNNHCVCVQGYKESDVHDELCVPDCVGGCANGFCNTPESCICDAGYQLDNSNGSQSCQPICNSDIENESGCINSICIEPNVCKCYEGFELSQNNTFLCTQIQVDPKAQTSHFSWYVSVVMINFANSSTMQ